MWIRGVALVGVAVLIVPLAACARPMASGPSGIGPTRPSPTAAAPSNVDPQACPASGVRVSAGATDAALGERVLELKLLNCGSTAYSPALYPSVRVLAVDGAAFDVTITDKATPGYAGPAPTPRPIHLEPGTQAAATLDWHDIVTYGPTVLGTYLDVVLRPGEAGQLVEPARGVDLGTTGALTVGPWVG